MVSEWVPADHICFVPTITTTPATAAAGTTRSALNSLFFLVSTALYCKILSIICYEYKSPATSTNYHLQ